LYKAHLQEPLQKYVDSVEKVSLVRTKKREGLIRARLRGAAVAKGEILVFLDSHCEAADGKNGNTKYEPTSYRLKYTNKSFKVGWSRSLIQLQEMRMYRLCQ
jgi:hypothetical protein